MNKKTRVDLHNHTTLCNHATGSVEEYVKRAIELGIDEYGFACHAPMNFDPKYRMKLEERNIYEKWVNEAKEKYKDKIKVLLAYEVDFLNGFMLDEILNANVDYLIGSVHFLQNKNEMWGFDNPEFIEQINLTIAHDNGIIMFHSPKGAARFRKYADFGLLNNWSAICISQAASVPIDEPIWEKLIIASKPNEAAMLELI